MTMNQNRHLMQPDSSPAFIDFKASSLDLIASYPIEVGLCLPDGTLHSWLIRPNRQWQDWSDSAEAIHGISRSRLEQEGRPVAEVVEQLNGFCQGRCSVMPGPSTVSGCTACTGQPGKHRPSSWSPSPCCSTRPRSGTGPACASR